MLDKDVARWEVFFYHQLIQEYFATRVMARQRELERAAVPWRSDEIVPTLAEELACYDRSDPLPPLPPTGCEETFLMAVAMSEEPEAFVTNLMAVNLVLAARCAAAPSIGISQRLR